MSTLPRKRALGRDEQGATVAEYIVLIALVALGLVAAFKTFGGSVFRASGDQGRSVTCVALGDSTSCGGGGGDFPPPPAAPPPGSGETPSPTGSGGSLGPVAANEPACTGETCKGLNCFVAGTPVATPTGFRPIEEIQAGDEVLTFREETSEAAVGHVSATFVTPDRDLLELHIRGESAPLRATPGHRFFTLDRGWVPAGELAGGEPLVDPGGAAVFVDYLVSAPARDTVYNFEVEDTHTYFVGPERILVHNPTDCGGAPGTPGIGSPSPPETNPESPPGSTPPTGGGPSPAVASLNGNLPPPRPPTLTELRSQYVAAVDAIGPQAQAKLNAGESEQEVAQWAWQERRTIGQQFKNLTPTPQRLVIYGRNYQKYGDTLGPTIPYLRGKGKSWSDIIRSSSTAGGGDLGLQGSSRPN